ncbi:MAG: hypothetical protein KGL79_06335, partial [Acidobacteriota bacterium]|nr:hypothetical protein [Acidobacteriota bacterium]
MSVLVLRERAARFTYVGLEVQGSSLVGHYRLDDLEFRERVDFDHVASLEGAATRAVATLWYVIAGLSYYKAGAAREVDFAETALGPRALA